LKKCIVMQAFDGICWITEKVNSKRQMSWAKISRLIEKKS